MAVLGIVLGAGFSVLAAVVVVRALLFRGGRDTGLPGAEPGVDPQRVADLLSAAVRCATVSHQDPAAFDPQPFADLRQEFERSFPRVHVGLAREIVSEHSLLYTWQGSDLTLKPVLLMGHLDVVPVEPGTEGNWTHPPFGGEIADGFVWGRGTLDTKASVVAILEAVEQLLDEGYRPRCTVYLAFGHDEEVSGLHGAKAIAEILASRGVEPEWVLDEGGAILAPGAFPGVNAPVAMVGVAEKGYLTLKLTAEGTGGHSAMPPRDTAVGTLARAIARLDRHPFPPRLREPVVGLLSAVGREMPFLHRIALANRWLFRPLVERAMLGNPATAALVRTTTAVTIVQAGTKENVLPQTAQATVNLRLLTGETTATALARVRRAVGPEVGVEPAAPGWDPSPVSPIGTEAYATMARVVRDLLPGAIVAPNLVSGATDSRYYARTATNTFRFVPIVMTKEDLGRVHGTNERISIENLARCVAFFRRLIRDAAREVSDEDR